MNKEFSTVSDERAIIGGQALAEVLHLKRDKEHKDRWITDWGTKTDLGLFRTVEQIMREASGL